MSWSFSVPNVEREQIGEKVDAAAAAYFAHLADGAAEETVEQVAAARSAAVSMAAAVGTGLLNISLSGHSNPGHGPRKGYSNEVINVSVSEASSG